MKSWKEPKAGLILAGIVGAVVLGIKSKAVRDGIVASGIVYTTAHILGSRIPSQEDQLELMREAVSSEFESYLEYVQEIRDTDQEGES